MSFSRFSQVQRIDARRLETLIDAEMRGAPGARFWLFLRFQGNQWPYQFLDGDGPDVFDRLYGFGLPLTISDWLNEWHIDAALNFPVLVAARHDDFRMPRKVSMEPRGRNPNTFKFRNFAAFAADMLSKRYRGAFDPNLGVTPLPDIPDFHPAIGEDAVPAAGPHVGVWCDQLTQLFGVVDHVPLGKIDSRGWVNGMLQHWDPDGLEEYWEVDIKIPTTLDSLPVELGR